MLDIAPGITVYPSAHLLSMNSIIIAGETASVVVDPGWTPEEIDVLQAKVRNTPAGRATHVFLTHADEDHLAGWEQFDNAVLIAHPRAGQRDAAHMEELVNSIDRKLKISRASQFRYPKIFAAPQTLDLGGEVMQFFSAPGHTADSMLAVLPGRQTIIAGDYLIDMEGPYVFHSLPEYRSTLTLIFELCTRFNITKLVPGHANIALDFREIQARIAADADYLERLEEAVALARKEGKSQAETIRDLELFSHRGRQIPGVWIDAHLNNIKLLYSQEQ